MVVGPYSVGHFALCRNDCCYLNKTFSVHVRATVDKVYNVITSNQGSYRSWKSMESPGI